MTETLTNGANGTNGASGNNTSSSAARSIRWERVPKSLDIHVSNPEGDADVVEIDLEELLDDPSELCTLLENENVSKTYWTTIAMAYAKQGKVENAIEIINRGLTALERRPNDKIGLYNCLCWLHFDQAREAPRVLNHGAESQARTKDHYLRAATSVLNEAARIDPSFPPTTLARGVLCLLQAALQQEKNDYLRQALRAFDDVIRVTGKTNMLAFIGRAKAQYSLGNIPEALQAYQHVLACAPHIVDPDPRIGIGACFWQLGHKDDAKQAWERALQLNPKCKIAHMLLGLFYLDNSAQYALNDERFASVYRKALLQYTQAAFKLDSNLPMACVTFGSFFLSKKAMEKVDTLCRKAIERTDINAIASDGWFTLARKEHLSGDVERASDAYRKADQARGGDERGYAPAKFGLAQVEVLRGEFDRAKFRLEQLTQHIKSVEAMTLLGTLLVEDVFGAESKLSPQEKSTAARRATNLFEAVRAKWKDESAHIPPDTSVLLNLARLYEQDDWEKSLKCLRQVEALELQELSVELDQAGKSEEEKDQQRAALREGLAPELLNNLGCFSFKADNIFEARDLFQIALTACLKADIEEADRDALVTTISYNLARTHEMEGSIDEARKIYEGLLERHSEYIDAKVRLSYIGIQQREDPSGLKRLYEDDPRNLDVRSLFGWYLRKHKSRKDNLAEDQEQRHHKHTLQNHDKLDRYALTAMGNLYLSHAREMRRESEQDLEKRSKMYDRAVEFFNKALELDPQNAYAAQGIAITLLDDKKQYKQALHILHRVKEATQDPLVYINLGHVHVELKEYASAIEAYEHAQSKGRLSEDAQLLSAIGRAWFLRGRAEKNPQHLEVALSYAEKALGLCSNSQQIAFKFNIAFVQFQYAALLIQWPEEKRKMSQVEAAAAGLEQAIEAFGEIATSPHPPFPRGDIEQRANMGKNTIRKQLERAQQTQKEYDAKMADRIAKSREERKADLERRAEEKRREDEARLANQERIARQRAALAEKDKKLIEAREEADRKRMEEQEEDRQGRRGPRKGGKRKKQDDGIIDDDDLSELEAASDHSRQGSAAPKIRSEERPRQKKKRKLERKNRETVGKFKSDEFVAESSDEDDDAGDGPDDKKNETDNESNGPTLGQRKVNRVIGDEDDDDDEEMSENANGEA